MTVRGLMLVWPSLVAAGYGALLAFDPTGNRATFWSLLAGEAVCGAVFLAAGAVGLVAAALPTGRDAAGFYHRVDIRGHPDAGGRGGVHPGGRRDPLCGDGGRHHLRRGVSGDG